jgi:hypothetical protein
MAETTETEQVALAARRARAAAAVFNIGNIVALLAPIPVGVIWLGASMIVYALNRRHPNPKVGEYTQRAAYRFYGIIGFFVVAATLIPGDAWWIYLVAWGGSAIILIPWSIADLIKISRDDWEFKQTADMNDGNDINQS